MSPERYIWIFEWLNMSYGYKRTSHFYKRWDLCAALHALNSVSATVATHARRALINIKCARSVKPALTTDFLNMVPSQKNKAQAGLISGQQSRASLRKFPPHHRGRAQFSGAEREVKLRFIWALHIIWSSKLCCAAWMRRRRQRRRPVFRTPRTSGTIGR